MDGTIINQGTFTSTGAATKINLVCDVDWMRVVNYTEASATNNGHGYEYYWQRGMATNTGIMYYHPAADHTAAINATATGFTLYNTSLQSTSALIVTTGSSNAAAPVVTTATTTGLVAFDSIIRLSNIAAAPTICGIDFTIQAVNPGVSFTLPTLANAVAAGGAGNYKIIAYDPIFYPRNRTVCNVTAAANPTITTTVNHGYIVGQKVRFVVPASCGMTQLNGVQATVLTTPTLNTFTIDASTAGFTAFAWPLAGAVPVSYANVVPVGEEAHGTYANLLNDATLNTGEMGIILAGGTTGPAGSNGDVIYWVAGKSFNV